MAGIILGHSHPPSSLSVCCHRDRLLPADMVCGHYFWDRRTSFASTDWTRLGEVHLPSPITPDPTLIATAEKAYTPLSLGCMHSLETVTWPGFLTSVPSNPLTNLCFSSLCRNMLPVFHVWSWASCLIALCPCVPCLTGMQCYLPWMPRALG